MGQFSSRKRHLPLFVVVFKSLLAPNAREIVKYKWKTKSVGKKIHFRSKSFSIVLVQGKHHSIIFQSNYICTKNLKYWTRMIPGDSRLYCQYEMWEILQGTDSNKCCFLLDLVIYVESQLNKLYSKFLQYVVMLQDYHQIHYLKWVKKNWHISCSPVLP